MMKHCLIVAGILLVMSTGAFAAGENIAAQNVTINVNEVNYLAANGTASFVITPAVTPGDIPVITPTQTGTLAYTSVLPSAGGARKITARITTDVPAGLQLGAAVSGVTGTGTVGTAAAASLLSASSDVEMVTGIGSCYTKLPVLTYSLGIIPGTGMALLKATAAPHTAVVTYTMTTLN